ncbi:hypothetical protein [Rhizobium sp. 42MFCr.1]|uniref:hypothetical protein n=1 Tax=unclassified Rhizobium TaxID=2613769 RepID=UPI001FD8C829|nr:hypothetical protein [Rhizobium sp. 42MFCr.1]
MTTIFYEALPVAHLTFDGEWRLDYIQRADLQFGFPCQELFHPDRCWRVSEDGAAL